MAMIKLKKLLKITAITGLATTLLLILTITAYFLLRAKPPPLPTTVSTIAEVETYLNDLVAFGTPPGLTLVIIKDGETRYHKGFGLADGPQNIEATPETIYKWWSMTKVFTAVAIMQLHERDQLNIDDPVADYLPFFDIEYTSPQDDKITIRHLLNHSSGIPDNVPEVMGWMHLEGKTRPGETEFLESVFSDYAQINFAPGTRSEYTNVGYMVLGAIIEHVSETSYEEFVVQNVLEPIQMNHTNFQYTPEMLPLAAAGSHPQIRWETLLLPFLFDDWESFIRETVDRRIWFNRFEADSNPPTGLIGSTEDLAHFLTAFLGGGADNGNRILAEDTLAMMLSESIIPATDTGQVDEEFQGLGWEVSKQNDTIEYIAHGGGGPGFGCSMRVYPKRNLAMAILANDTTYNHIGILDLVAQLEW